MVEAKRADEAERRIVELEQEINEQKKKQSQEIHTITIGLEAHIQQKQKKMELQKQFIQEILRELNSI